MLYMKQLKVTDSAVIWQKGLSQNFQKKQFFAYYSFLGRKFQICNQILKIMIVNGRTGWVDLGRKSSYFQKFFTLLTHKGLSQFSPFGNAKKLT